DAGLGECGVAGEVVGQRAVLFARRTGGLGRSARGRRGGGRLGRRGGLRGCALLFGLLRGGVGGRLLGGIAVPLGRGQGLLGGPHLGLGLRELLLGGGGGRQPAGLDVVDQGVGRGVNLGSHGLRRRLADLRHLGVRGQPFAGAVDVLHDLHGSPP